MRERETIQRSERWRNVSQSEPFTILFTFCSLSLKASKRESRSEAGKITESGSWYSVFIWWSEGKRVKHYCPWVVIDLWMDCKQKTRMETYSEWWRVQRDSERENTGETNRSVTRKVRMKISMTLRKTRHRKRFLKLSINGNGRIAKVESRRNNKIGRGMHFYSHKHGQVESADILQFLSINSLEWLWPEPKYSRKISSLFVSLTFALYFPHPQTRVLILSLNLSCPVPMGSSSSTLSLYLRIVCNFLPSIGAWKREEDEEQDEGMP